MKLKKGILLLFIMCRWHCTFGHLHDFIFFVILCVLNFVCKMGRIINAIARVYLPEMLWDNTKSHLHSWAKCLMPHFWRTTGKQNQVQKKAVTMVRELSGSICVITYSGCSQKAELGPEMDSLRNLSFTTFKEELFKPLEFFWNGKV